MYDFINDPRFKGIEPFKNKLWLSSPTMHGDEQRWVDEAIRRRVKGIKGYIGKLW